MDRGTVTIRTHFIKRLYLNGILVLLLTIGILLSLTQPSGNTGGQIDTLRLPCHNATWIEHTESKARNTDALPTHFMI